MPSSGLLPNWSREVAAERPRPTPDSRSPPEMEIKKIHVLRERSREVALLLMSELEGRIELKGTDLVPWLEGGAGRNGPPEQVTTKIKVGEIGHEDLRFYVRHTSGDRRESMLPPGSRSRLPMGKEDLFCPFPAQWGLGSNVFRRKNEVFNSKGQLHEN
jgi:hypothetical protein